MKSELTEFGPYTGKHINLFLIKCLIKKCIKFILYPFIYSYFILRFHNIWNLKRYLVKKNITGGLLTSFYIDYFNKRGSYVGLNSKILNEPYFPHGLYGIFISDNATIGKNCVIFQHVTIGSNTIIGSKGYGYPIIEDNVYIGCGAKIIGNVVIKNNSRIGAGSIITNDIDENTLAIPNKIITIKKKNKMDNRFTFESKSGYFYYDNGSFKKLKNK